MNETGAHTQPDKPGRMIVATRLNKFRRIGNNHTSFVVVCPFHASGDVFFLLVILFFTDFPLKFFSTQSASVFVYLHFAPFSKPHQSVIFVLGAKVIPGLDGKARSSLLFSVKISSPAGSILTVFCHACTCIFNDQCQNSIIIFSNQRNTAFFCELDSV